MANKRKKQTISEEYTALTPVDYVSDEGYMEALDWAINNPEVNNIALAGPNGSGKSSIIRTYLKEHNGINKKSIIISMSSFQTIEWPEKSDKKDDEEVLKGGIDRDEIETGILKQLLYKVEFQKIPKSRYRKLHKNSWLKIWGIILLCLAILFVLFDIFIPDLTNVFLDKISSAGDKINITPGISYMFFVILVVGLCLLVSIICCRLVPHFRVREIKLPTDTVLRLDDSEETVFNKNMDEIVYFFEATSYRYVFFEDLDRLEDAGVFIHLRELNLLLNRYDAIKHPIIFIYAVRDDIFTKEDRTKFFDFIIPVIPYVNVTNSGDEFLRIQKKLKENGIISDLSESFILDVSPYINDMRILQNICNEFALYKRNLSTGQGLLLRDEMMMSMIIFKNLYPKDFAEAQKEEGIIRQAFLDKENFIKRQLPELEKAIKAESNDIKQFVENNLVTEKDVKSAMLSALANWEGVVTSIKINSKTYKVNEIMEDTFDYSVLLEGKNCQVHYRPWNQNNEKPRQVDDFMSITNPYIESLRVIQKMKEKGIESIHVEIENLRAEVRCIRGKCLKDLIKDYGAEKVLSENVRKNEPFTFMLRRGYIDENYAAYINYFKEGSITLADNKFILSIKNKTPLPFNYKLTKVDNIIKRLQPYEFEEQAANNFDLLDALLENDELEKDNIKEKREYYFRRLSDASESSWELIDEFIEETKHKGKFIRLLAKSWIGMWDNIVDNAEVSYERKRFYFYQLIDSLSIEELDVLNANQGSITSFFTSDPDILQDFPLELSDKVIGAIEHLDVIFDDVMTESVPENVVEYIFDHCRYVLNMKMIRRIIAYKNPELLNMADTQNYTVVRKLNYSPLVEYIQNNLDTYVENVVLENNNTQESMDSVIDLLRRTIDFPEIGSKILEHENCWFEHFTDCCGEFAQIENESVYNFWNTLLHTEKISMTWDNIYIYWENYAITEDLIEYIEAHADELKNMNCNCLQDDFIEEFLTSSVNDEAFERIVPSLRISEFTAPFEKISESKMLVLIDNHYFDFDVEKYQELQAVYPDLETNYILNNQDAYMDVKDELEMDAALLQKLILNPQMKKENCQILFSEFGIEFMNEEIAEAVYKRKLSLGAAEFETVWGFLDKQKELLLMFEHMDMLTADQFKMCFSSLEDMYPGFSDRSRRHDVIMNDNAENRKLAERLKAIEYITSWKQIQTQKSKPLFGDEFMGSIIECKIKAQK